MNRTSEHDIIGGKPPRDETAGLGLFDAVREVPASEAAEPPRHPPRAVPSARDSDGRDDRTEAIERLKQLVEEPLLARAVARRDLFEAPGVVADDVVALAKSHSWAQLLGTEQRAWSWVGPWLSQLARAGKLSEFCAAGQIVRRRSTRPGAHGNLQVVYLDPADHRAIGKAA